MTSLFQDPRQTRLQNYIAETARLRALLASMRAQADAVALWVENNGNSVVASVMLRAMVAGPAAQGEESEQ